MRVIEKNMNAAIRSRKDFRSSNTEVYTYFCSAKNEVCAIVKLHGNKIAEVYKDSMLLFDGGWQSNTTKSRLNALCQEFATGHRVFQKNWDWFVSDFKGNKTDFLSGMEIAVS